MTSWSETARVFTRIHELREGGIPCALATVVDVRGSAYRRQGAKMLVGTDGSIVGNVSGGCLELDVREVAHRVMKSGHAERRTYCSGTDQVAAWDLGVGCEGSVEIFIDPVRDSRIIEQLCMAKEEPFAIVTMLEPAAGTRIVLSREGVSGSLGDQDIDAIVREVGAGFLARQETATFRYGARAALFIDCLIPEPRLLIVGAGDDARPLARLALDAGFRVTVVDRRPGLLTAERFPNPIVRLESSAEELSQRLALSESMLAVVMTHNFVDDRDYLEALRPLPLEYIGLLGPAQRSDRILALLNIDDDPRIHGPAGLDIGGEGAEQVAIAILAELLAVRRGRHGGFLRERVGPIHGLLPADGPS